MHSSYLLRCINLARDGFAPTFQFAFDDYPCASDDYPCASIDTLGISIGKRQLAVVWPKGHGNAYQRTRGCEVSVFPIGNLR